MAYMTRDFRIEMARRAELRKQMQKRKPVKTDSPKRRKGAVYLRAQ